LSCAAAFSETAESATPVATTSGIQIFFILRTPF
jgi:hypothetical protein